MGFFDFISPTDKRHAHVAMVMSVARADGHIADEESTFVAFVATKLGLDLKDFKKALKMGGKEAGAHLAAMSKGERAVVLADCIRCSMVDGHMDDSENAFNGTLGAILDINGHEFETVLNNLDKSDDVLRHLL